MHRFATTILRRTFSRHPAIALQTVQQGHKRWFFDAEKRSDLGLGQRTGRHGQMQQGPPLSLAQTNFSRQARAVPCKSGPNTSTSLFKAN